MKEEEIIEKLRNILVKKLNALLKSLITSYKKDKKSITDIIGEQQGESLEEKISSIIKELKKPQYTKKVSSFLKNSGYEVELENNTYYIRYKTQEQETKIEMPKDIKELYEQLELLDGVNSINSESSKDALEEIIINIFMNMFLQADNGNIDKDVLQEINEEMNIDPYKIVVDSNGSIGVDIEDRRDYLPIRLSRKMLALGVLQDEQTLIQSINDTIGKGINNILKSNNGRLSKEVELLRVLKEKKDSILFIDGRYYLEVPETNTVVELSIEQNGAILELENNIFNEVRDSYSVPDSEEKNIDFRSYDALLKLIELGFKIERDETSNKIIITSVTGREFTKEQSDFFDLDFSKLPFIKEKPKSKRSELTKENLERVLKLSRNIDTKTVELMQKLADVKEMTNADVEAQTNYIKDVFLNRTCSIIAIDRKYYIIGQDFQIPLTDEQYEFLSKLEENLFNTIYNSEKDSDVDGEKSVVQDVNGYNTLIQMMGLGYIFNMITDEENNIVDDRVLITSPTGKILIRSINDFENIKMGEIHWDVQEDNKTNYFKLQTLKNYKELAEYINNKIYPAIEIAEKHLDGNGDNLQIELSIKYLLEALNPNDGDKLTSYVNGVYVIVSEKNEIAISLDKTLSEKIDRLTKEYIEILYQNNKTTSKKPSNEQGKSKEDIIEDIRSYFSNGGIKIEDIENKISPVFDENGERISIDFNAQKTIIQLMELGYRFKVIDEIAFDENMSPVKDGEIEITSPCGKTFICSALEYNENGLPHTQKMFDQIQAFAKSEEESKDYSTTNFYDFLMKDAEKENKSYKRKQEDKRAKERYEAGENKRKLNEFTREPIVKKINEIQELRQNNEDYFKQLIFFYRSLQEIENIEMKYNAEFGVHVIYNYSTEAYTILPKEQSQVLGELAKEFVDYTLKEGGKSDFEFDDLSGFITLLQLGFVVKPVQENEKKRMDIYDPFDQYVEIYRSNKNVKNMETSDKSCVEYYISMQEMIECVNKTIAPKMRKVKTEQKPTYEQIKDILKSIGELTTSNGDSIKVDENKNKLCFINEENGYSIPLNKEQIEFITAIEDKFDHDDIYIAMAKTLIKTISAKDNGSDGNGTAMITCSESQEPNYIAVSYIMYKTLKDLGLDFTVYEGDISRLQIEFPWNTTKPIQADFNFFPDDLASKEIWIRLPKTQDSLDLYDEAYSLGITDGEKFVDFLIKRAIEDYKKTHTLDYLMGKAKNLGQRAEVFRNRITAPVQHKIGTSAQVSNPAGPIYTALGMFTGKKPHTSIIAGAIQCKGIASEDPSNPDKPGSTEEGVGKDD